VLVTNAIYVEARAISSLDRILKRIRVTVINLLRLSSKEPSPVLDYDSLMSLSNTSRIEAIKTINRLSRRLESASPSRVSTTYTSTSTSTVKTPSPSTPPQAHPSRQKGHSSHRSSHSSSQHSTTTSNKKRDKSPAAPSSPKKKKSSTKVKADMPAKVKADAGPKPRDEPKLARPREEAPSSKPKEEKFTKPKDDAGHPTRPKEDVDTTATAQPRQDKNKPSTSAPTKTRPSTTIEFEETTPPPSQRTDPNIPARRPVGLAARVAAAADNRISIASFTSDSTKIGEIPDRKPGSRYYAPASPGSDQYNVAPLYPLRPYRVEPSGKGGERGFWGGLFGTKKKESSSSMSSSST